jgi:hypothetical protein
MKSHFKLVETFLPYSLEERILKMRERLTQAWPSFGRSSRCAFPSELDLREHHGGTVVRFFVGDDALTFTGLAAVKHGAHWFLSEPIDDAIKLTGIEMRAYLKVHNLSWVVVL